MKLLVLLVLAGLSSRVGRAQSGTLALSNDPVFNQVLARRVSYPALAIRSATYGRIYAGFDINSQGHIKNITILSPENRAAGFGYEVRAALRRMPPLSPRYAGQYALPVAFILTNWGERQESYIPKNTMPRSSLTGRLLLDEVVFQGSLRLTGVYMPPGQEIRYY